MKKLELLRRHLLASVPGLADNPERLLTFVEQGSIEFHRAATQPVKAPSAYSHGYDYEAHLVITDYSGEVDAVVVPLLQWLAHYEPGARPGQALRIEAEILDSQTWDLSLTVPLSERVLATLDCDSGRIDVEHRLPEYPVEPCAAAHWQLYIRGPDLPEPELIAEWDTPEWINV